MLMLRKIVGCLFGAVMCISCTREVLDVSVTNEVISSDYIGNGAEWDPYDEAVSWGCDVSEEDWRTLTSRIDVMGMGYVRCMINSRFLYWDAAREEYVRDRNIDRLEKVLRYCQDHGITVMYGEFNPPEPRMRDSQEWVKMSVNYLDHLVNGLGFDCIRHFVIFNEPDGDWASTNGDYGLWLSMVRRFDEEMGRYPGLKEKVSLAAPDVVVHWVHPETGLTADDWIRRTVEDMDELVGIYDVHAYPGQTEVRDGSYARRLKALREAVPAGKRMILGEAGFKYDKPGDELLLQENLARAEAHPYAGGADSNMMVYDHFYGLDMALLAMDVMNSGYSGMAVWMLDDAAHSVGDVGRPDNIKVWGFWNTLGEEVFGCPEEEAVRPWYWAWTLMCRCFPKGCDILTVEPCGEESVRMCAAEKDGRQTFAVVNWAEKDRRIRLAMPERFEDASVYVYEEGRAVYDGKGWLVASDSGLCGEHLVLDVPASSLVIITDMNVQD